MEQKKELTLLETMVIACFGTVAIASYFYAVVPAIINIIFGHYDYIIKSELSALLLILGSINMLIIIQLTKLFKS